MVSRIIAGIMLASLSAGCKPVVGQLPDPAKPQTEEDIPASPPRFRRDPLLTLIGRLHDLTGQVQQECGRFVLPTVQPEAGPDKRDVLRAVECIRKAATMRQPAWMLAEQQGIDSWVATGILVRGDGRVDRFSYDSYGGDVQFEECRQPSAEAGPRTVNIVCDRK